MPSAGISWYQSVCAQLSPSTRTTYPSSRAFRSRVSPYRQSFERCFQRNLSSPSSEMRKRTACSCPSAIDVRHPHGRRCPRTSHPRDRASGGSRPAGPWPRRTPRACTRATPPDPVATVQQSLSALAALQHPNPWRNAGLRGPVLHCCTRITGGSARVREQVRHRQPEGRDDLLGRAAGVALEKNRGRRRPRYEARRACPRARGSARPNRRRNASPGRAGRGTRRPSCSSRLESGYIRVVVGFSARRTEWLQFPGNGTCDSVWTDSEPEAQSRPAWVRAACRASMDRRSATAMPFGPPGCLRGGRPNALPGFLRPMGCL